MNRWSGLARASVKWVVETLGSSRRTTAAKVAVLWLAWVFPSAVHAQNAVLAGVIRDSQAAAISGAQVRLVQDATTIVINTRSNERGSYVFASVRPGTYRLEAMAEGFAMFSRDNIVLSVDQRTELDLTLLLPGHQEEVNVTAKRPMLGMADGSLGTVIDRRLAADLPIRGRSFSTLVALTPGVSALPGGASSSDGSEFQVNGQRSDSNSLTVDGVSAPSEMGAGGMNNGAGQRFSTSVTGTVNGGLSMDAVQEIRVQTSSFAAEFGRTPGAQISLVTRSGTNHVSGSAFGQFRDDRLMANDWFANSRGVHKPSIDERQFGGTFGGPILSSRLFFFGSYEGMRLKQPMFVVRDVPSVEARSQHTAVREVLNAFPLPTGPSREDMTAEYAAFHPLTYSSDILGLRVDHVLPRGMQLFGRYSQGPSLRLDQSPFAAAATLEQYSRAVTAGWTAAIGTRALLEVRGNYSTSKYMWAGTAGLREWFPNNVSADSWFQVGIVGLPNIYAGSGVSNRQKQSNIVASLAYLHGRHHIKVGSDYRVVRPSDNGYNRIVAELVQVKEALLVPSVASLNVERRFPVHASFQNVSFYIQDTWKPANRLSVMYGLRWDINPAPSFVAGEGPLAAIEFQPITQLKISTTRGRPLWKTAYGNVFPRLGVSYRVDESGRTVLSAGAGVFGDLTGGAAGAAAALPVGAWTQLVRTNVPLPLSAGDVQGIEEPNLEPPYGGSVVVVDPRLGTPQTIQWNSSLQRAIADQQDVSISYVGALGRRLLQTSEYAALNRDFPETVYAVTASGRSRYHAMQIQYRSYLRWGVHGLASYTLSRADDTVSHLSAVDRGDVLAPSSGDLRHMFNAGLSWELPELMGGRLAWLTKDWSLHLVALSRSGYPFSVEAAWFDLVPGQERLQRRASLVPGMPVIIADRSAPGGRRYNRAAFTDPPLGEQGDTGRNAFRGNGASQFDLGLQRGFPLLGRARVRIRIDAFNVLNAPVFALPVTDLASPSFGASTSMASSGLRRLYGVGGPRNVSCAVRLEF